MFLPHRLEDFFGNVNLSHSCKFLYIDDDRKENMKFIVFCSVSLFQPQATETRQFSTQDSPPFESIRYLRMMKEYTRETVSLFLTSP